MLNVPVAENGRPRDDAPLQAWLECRGNLLMPKWNYTEADGRHDVV